MTSRSPAWVKLVCLLVASTFVSGCGRTYEDNIKPPSTEKTPFALGGSGSETVKLTPIKATKGAVLSGKVVFSGVAPPKRLVADSKPECMDALKTVEFKNDVYDQDWFVGEGEGVKNVVIFLKAPDGSFFQVDDGDKKAAEKKASIDQPFCAFHPQVLIHYPGYLKEDGSLVPTGQKPVIKNHSAGTPILHNANLQGADPKYNSGFNVNIPSGTEKDDFTLNPQPRPLWLECSIHPWMKAHIWVFNHPYAARTNDKGEFTINNIPTGVDLQVVCWHPTVGFFGEGEAAGKKMNFKDKANTMNLTISPR